MKRLFAGFAIVAFATMSTVSVAQNTRKIMENTVDTVSYSLGLLIAQNLQSQGFEALNYDLFMTAFKDAMMGKPSLIDPQAASQFLTQYQSEISHKKGSVAREIGEKFLAENKKKKGVITLPSGLQYEILKAGKGAKPTATDKVKTHYHGTLISGEVFDSSVQRNEPATFGVNQVIKGWTEALQLMPVGSKWKLYIPFDLAYGERGAGGNIGPYSALIFEVELLSIEK